LWTMEDSKAAAHRAERGRRRACRRGVGARRGREHLAEWNPRQRIPRGLVTRDRILHRRPRKQPFFWAISRWTMEDSKIRRDLVTNH